MAASGNLSGRILIVDDDRDARTLIARVLQQVGYETYEAESGEQAVTAARRERPALVVLDLILPGISGYEVCRQLKDASGGALPVVFVSGARVESVDRVAGLLVGGDDYLVKPFDPGELVARVRRLLHASIPGDRPEGLLESKLTSREIEVLSLLAEGLSQAAIGERLFISPKTVGKHVEHILAKLGVSSRAHAVALAVRSGLPDAVHPTDVASPPQRPESTDPNS